MRGHKQPVDSIPARRKILRQAKPRSNIIDPSTSAHALQSTGHTAVRRGQTPSLGGRERWPEPTAGRCLGGAASAGGGIAHSAVDERPLQRIQMRQQGCDFGQKRIAQNGVHFVVAAAA